MYTKKLQELPVQHFKVMIDVATCHLYLKRQLGSASHSSGRNLKTIGWFEDRLPHLVAAMHHNISLSWCFIQWYVTWHHLYVFCLTNLLATLHKSMNVNHVQIYRFICSCIAHLNDGLPQSSQFSLCSPSLWTSAFLSTFSPYGTGEPCVINHKLQ